MSSKSGPDGPQPSFPEGKAGGTERQTDSSSGCIYETPDGQCGDPGATYDMDGISVELCHGHMFAVLEQNDLERSQAQVER
ncbi:hypothetical protein C435_15468 [Haloarcula marismortui ATCC 33799]|uniref:Uncharacterized protein n=1 Tax=Haloarcula marismortui ATCC 33799 TaxID=662475 RepID=M0K304_9EURY|nr:hypothetical protein C435_15468 [Haloarcula californiae ATCC 33799]